MSERLEQLGDIGWDNIEGKAGDREKTYQLTSVRHTVTIVFSLVIRSSTEQESYTSQIPRK